MSVLQEIEDLSKSRRPGISCGVPRMLQQIPHGDRADVSEAVRRTATIKSSAIAKFVGDRYGIRINGQALQRHRRGVCSCLSSTR